MKVGTNMHIIKHFITITSHRLKVMNMCFRCGLYWRGLTHDLSKYSPKEFLEGAKYYAGSHSPISECKKKTGKSEAWLHHKGRNPHHPEYWVDSNKPVMMPYQYVVESICDRIAAGKTYKKEKFNQTCKYCSNKYMYAPLKYFTKVFESSHKPKGKFFNFKQREYTDSFFDNLINNM